MNDIFDIPNPIQYTPDQRQALNKVQTFLESGNSGIMVLSGFAGTGKTTLIDNIYQFAKQVKSNKVGILAITHRALHVIREKFKGIGSQCDLATIHSTLYGCPETKEGKLIFSIGSPRPLKETADIFIVDEASMIPREILDDLKAAMGPTTQIIFLGDSYQLKPIGRDQDHDMLMHPDAWLTQVCRYDSNLLDFATAIRELKQIRIPRTSVKDINMFRGDTVAVYLDIRQTDDDTIIVCSTNKERVYFNARIRHSLYSAPTLPLLPRETLISISNNNYLANGALFQVREILEDHGERTVTLRMKDREIEETYHAYLVTDYDDNEFQIYLFPKTYLPSIYNGQIPELRDSDNRIDMTVVICTYGYAITCHKAQGGQWPKVIINQTGFRDDPRWFYTALTRAQTSVWLNKSYYPPRFEKSFDEFRRVADRFRTKELV